MKSINVFLALLALLGFGGNAFAQSGSISGSPNPCTLSSSSGTCTATISWSSSGGSPGVFLRETNQLVAGTPSGSYSATYVNINGYHFDLRASYTSSSSALLASVFVVGVLPSGNISASPNPCTVTSGSSCTSTISWSSSGAAHAGVFLRETGQLVGGTTSGTYSASYINTSGYHFDLRSDYSSSSSTLLASVFVTANQTPSGQISASPNPCTITTGSSCTSTISWSSSAAPQAGVFLRETGQLVAGTGSGSYSATFINTSGYHFDLRVNYTSSSSTLLSSTFVQGTAPTGSVSASPNPCTIPNGTNMCTAIISWTSHGASNPGLFIHETGQFVASGTSGSYTATYINVNGYHFDLRATTDAGSTLIATSPLVIGVGAPAPVFEETFTSFGGVDGTCTPDFIPVGTPIPSADPELGPMACNEGTKWNTLAALDGNNGFYRCLGSTAPDCWISNSSLAYLEFNGLAQAISTGTSGGFPMISVTKFDRTQYVSAEADVNLHCGGEGSCYTSLNLIVNETDYRGLALYRIAGNSPPGTLLVEAAGPAMDSALYPAAGGAQVAVGENNWVRLRVDYLAGQALKYYVNGQLLRFGSPGGDQSEPGSHLNATLKSDPRVAMYFVGLATGERSIGCMGDIRVYVTSTERAANDPGAPHPISTCTTPYP